MITILEVINCKYVTSLDSSHTIISYQLRVGPVTKALSEEFLQTYESSTYRVTSLTSPHLTAPLAKPETFSEFEVNSFVTKLCWLQYTYNFWYVCTIVCACNSVWVGVCAIIMCLVWYFHFLLYFVYNIPAIFPRTHCW